MGTPWLLTILEPGFLPFWNGRSQGVPIPSPGVPSCKKATHNQTTFKHHQRGHPYGQNQILFKKNPQPA